MSDVSPDSMFLRRSTRFTSQNVHSFRLRMHVAFTHTHMHAHTHTRMQSHTYIHSLAISFKVAVTNTKKVTTALETVKGNYSYWKIQGNMVTKQQPT